MSHSTNTTNSLMRAAIRALGLSAIAGGSFVAATESAEACWICRWDGALGSVCTTNWIGYDACSTYYSPYGNNCVLYGNQCG